MAPGVLGFELSSTGYPPGIFSGVAMSKRRFEMSHYQQALLRMRQGDSNRDIAKSGLMGRKKLARLRGLAQARGWLEAGKAPPDEAALAEAFGRQEDLPASCVSSAIPWRDEIAAWQAAGVSGTRIHQVLQARHGYTGSYSSVYRLLRQLEGS